MVKSIENLTQKEMSRKEFLATMGLGLGSIMGLSTVIHMLTGRSLQTHLKSNGYRTGYGRSGDKGIA
jgi:hypothetical protein